MYDPRVGMTESGEDVPAPIQPDKRTVDRVVQRFLVDKRRRIICLFEKFVGGMNETGIAKPFEVHDHDAGVEIGFAVAEFDDLTQKFMPRVGVPSRGSEGRIAGEPEIQTCRQREVQQIGIVERRDVVKNNKVAVEINHPIDVF